MENENRELQKLESMPLKTSEEKFQNARRAPKIGMATDEEIKQALRYAMVKIGLRGANVPGDEEKLMLILHVRENFPANTIEDIKLAFDWGIEGRLDEDINCFENFSCLYFTRIMRSYNRLACKVRNDAKNKTAPRLPQAKKEEPVIEDPEAYEKFMQTGLAQILKGKGIEIPKF